MEILIKEIKEGLERYSKIPIKFEVCSVFRLKNKGHGLDGIDFIEEKIKEPYIKDYNSADETIEDWRKEFDMSNWGVFIAEHHRCIVGGITIAYDTPGVNMLAGGDDISVVWDIRIHPDYRRKGIGSRLFDYAVEWSKQRNCKYLKIETQNINVPACKFYVSKGCELGFVDKYAYQKEGLEDEIKLVWFKKLTQN